MDRAAFEQVLVDLGWSLWTELGVPGVVRRHAHMILDLEPLVLATPMLATADARLRVEVRRWLDAHGRWLSTSRLKGLERATTDPRAKEAIVEAAAFRPEDRQGPPPTLRMERPALLQLRLRALVGVGARADTLGHLLHDPTRPVTATDLAWLGYSKRTMAGILSDLDAGGLVRAHPIGNRIAYRLRQPEHLASLVAADGLQTVCWRSVFALLSEVEALFGLADKSAPVRRVAAVKRLDVLGPIAHRLERPPPPSLAGHPDAWERLLDWATAQVTHVTSSHTASQE